ncbi:MAG: hypothetical protein ACLQBD_05840 [Syntrophobacteraceae bacterium]
MDEGITAYLYHRASVSSSGRPAKGMQAGVWQRLVVCKTELAAPDIVGRTGSS